MMIILGVICVIVLIVIIGKNPLNFIVHIDLYLLSQWNESAVKLKVFPIFYIYTVYILSDIRQVTPILYSLKEI